MTFYWEDKYNIGNINGSYTLTEKQDFGFEYSYIMINDSISEYTINNEPNKLISDAKIIEKIKKFVNDFINEQEIINEKKLLEIQAINDEKEQAEKEQAEKLQIELDKQNAYNEKINSEPYKTNIASLNELNRTDWQVIRELERMFLKDSDLNVLREQLRTSILPEPEPLEEL